MSETPETPDTKQDRPQFRGPDGEPLKNGRVVVFDIGDQQPGEDPEEHATVYSEPSHTKEGANPILLDEKGYADHQFYLKDGFYIISVQRFVDDHESVIDELNDGEPYLEVQHSKVLRVMNGVGDEISHEEAHEEWTLKVQLLQLRLEQFRKLLEDNDIEIPEEEDLNV